MSSWLRNEEEEYSNVSCADNSKDHTPGVGDPSPKRAPSSLQMRRVLRCANSVTSQRLGVVQMGKGVDKG